MLDAKGQEIAKMIKSGKWSKIDKKFLNSNDENRLALAKALSTTSADEGYNALINLMTDSNLEIQREAVISLGLTASERAASQLQWLLTKIDASNTDTEKAIRESIAQIRARK